MAASSRLSFKMSLSVSGETTLNFSDVTSIYFSSGYVVCISVFAGCSLADLQQFFTGKLYVLMYQLKLPAEELLWSALSCTEEPAPHRRRPEDNGRIRTSLWPSYKIMSRVPRCWKSLLLMRHVHVFGFMPWHLLYHVTKVLHHGIHLCHSGLVFMIAVQFSVCF